MIKLVAIDLDGTLLNEAKQISQRNRDTLRRAAASGCKVVICTGRPLDSIKGYIEDLALDRPDEYSITFNGGLVQENLSGLILHEEHLTIPQAKQMFGLAQDLALPLDLIKDHTVYHLQPEPIAHPSIYAQLNANMVFSTAKLQDFPEDDIFQKMVIAAEADYLEQQIKKIPETYFQEFNLLRSRKCLLEVLHQNVSKANGLDCLRQHLQIDRSEIMAIGDEENDLSMIDYAGIGVAMDNGVAVVKEAAQFITGSNKEDGVAQAVERFVLK